MIEASGLSKRYGPVRAVDKPQLYRSSQAR